MSDLFEEENDDAAVNVDDDFIDVDADDEVDVALDSDKAARLDLDARRKLESMLDERRLRDELDDFGDY